VDAVFEAFEKIPRLKRGCVITEKIDGTNAQVYFADDGSMYVGSRNRWITPSDDNFGFARWCADNESELRKLGPGRHFGEWWGAGIQRRYGMPDKRFSLFNTGRWANVVGTDAFPTCVSLVPVLYSGDFSTGAVDAALERLRVGGSVAAPGFMQPEGVVVFHVQSRSLYKVTLGDDGHKEGRAA
jgi:hypothetical protein